MTPSGPTTFGHVGRVARISVRPRSAEPRRERTLWSCQFSSTIKKQRPRPRTREREPLSRWRMPSFRWERPEASRLPSGRLEAWMKELTPGINCPKALRGGKREGYASVREARWVFSFSKLLHNRRAVKSRNLRYFLLHTIGSQPKHVGHPFA